MGDFWTVNNTGTGYRNQAGYQKLVRPVAWTVEGFVEAEEPLTVLDIGSANGAPLDWFAEELGEETGREVETIGLEPQSIVRTDYSQGNSDHQVRGMAGNTEGTEIPVQDNSIDIVLSNYLMPFMDAETQSQMLREVEEIVQPGGCVALHTDPADDGNDASVLGHWVMSYEDFAELGEETEGFTDYPLQPASGTNRYYSDNRDGLPDGFYDRFREML